MITCCELVDLLVDFVAEELPPERCQQIQEHLQGCPPCRVYVETYCLTVRMCRRLPCSNPPQEVMQRLQSALASHVGNQTTAGGGDEVGP